MDPSAPQGPQIAIRVPSELEEGVYANFLGVWHTPHEFTLDFAVSMPMTAGGEGEVPFSVVARVKVPPTLVFDVMRAINENMTAYEENFGPIRRPGGEST